MSGHIMPFLFEGEKMMRLVLQGAVETWVARDWAVALGYRDPKKAIAAHCKHAMPVGKGGDTPPLGLHPDTLLIPEGDVWRLIVRSNLPDAERIERWLMDEVLPAIRRTGSYHLPGAETAREGDMVAPEDLSSLPIANTKNELLNTCARIHGLPSAQELWALLKCPITPSMELNMRQRPLDMNGMSHSREVAIFRPRGGFGGEAG